MKSFIYSVSPSPDSDVSTQTQLLIACTHSLFARESVCVISLGAPDLELHLTKKRDASLPGDGETEYNNL